MVGLTSLQKKAWGCLIGVAVGDAMGMPSSFIPREKIKKDIGEIDAFLPAPKGHAQHDGLIAGQITDDTQQTICVAHTLIEDGIMNPEGLGRRLVEWAKTEGVFGQERGIVGPTTRLALKDLDRGLDFRTVGRYGKTNGAVMRISPVGIIHAGDKPGDIMDDVENACMPTHWTDIAIAGAGAVASIIATSLISSDIDQAIHAAYEAIRIGLERGNSVSSSSLEKRLDFALNIVKEKRNKTEIIEDLCDLIGNELPIYEAVPFAIAVFYLARGNPMEGIKLAVNAGGDADTTGSIVGAMCGAYSGINAFPEDVIETIEYVNHLHLKDLALKLLNRRTKH